jgi:hypothetical protein
MRVKTSASMGKKATGKSPSFFLARHGDRGFYAQR